MNNKTGAKIMLAVVVMGGLVMAGGLRPLATAASNAAPTLPTMTPMVSMTPVFSGKAPNQSVLPAHYPCAVGMVKGNRTSNIYHVPGGKSYDKTFRDVTCFATAVEAKAAGFKAAKK